MTLTKSATTSVGIASKMQQISSKFQIYDAFFNKKNLNYTTSFMSIFMRWNMYNSKLFMKFFRNVRRIIADESGF